MFVVVSARKAGGSNYLYLYLFLLDTSFHQTRQPSVSQGVTFFILFGICICFCLTHRLLLSEQGTRHAGATIEILLNIALNFGTEVHSDKFWLKNIFVKLYL